MALVSESQTSELDLQHRMYKSEGALFKLPKVGAPLGESFFDAFPGVKKLCVVKCLKALCNSCTTWGKEIPAFGLGHERMLNFNI